jgi:hypothetical protein
MRRDPASSSFRSGRSPQLRGGEGSAAADRRTRRGGDKLEAEGKLRILTPDKVHATAHSKGKIAREANNVRATMIRNQEVLIQGLIPGDLLTPAK